MGRGKIALVTGASSGIAKNLAAIETRGMATMSPIDGDFQALMAKPWLDHHAVLDDRAQIKNILYQYSWLIDFPPRDDLSSVFTEDVIFELPEMDVKWEGEKVVTKMIKDIEDKLDFAPHYVTNVQIKIQGDKAVSRSYFYASVGRKGTPGGDHMTEGGRYYDQFVRTGDGWRIKKRSCYLDWVAGNKEVINVGGIGDTLVENA